MTFFMIYVRWHLCLQHSYLSLTDASLTYYKNVYIKIVYNYFVNIKLKVE